MLNEAITDPPLTVVKVGGHELEDVVWVGMLARLLCDAAPVVVVHGGGREISAVQHGLGLEPAWRDGLRVTSPASMQVVAMVLNGLVNKRIVAALLSAGVEAAGLSGEDGVLWAEVAHEGSLGRVGSVREVRPKPLRALLAAGVLPVLSPVSRGPDGGALNVNADDAALAVAVALGAARLLYVSNVAGVLHEGALLDSVSTLDTESLISLGAVSGGMAPKLRAAAAACAAGVGDVRIGGLDLLGGGAGTRVRSASEVAA